MNVCTTCGQDFGSTRAFDSHRVGKFAQTGDSEYRGHPDDWTPARGRRCLDIEEMEVRGFVRNVRGAWSLGDALLSARKLRNASIGSEGEASSEAREAA